MSHCSRFEGMRSKHDFLQNDRKPSKFGSRVQFTDTTEDIQGVLRYIHQDILKHAVISGWDCPENFTTGGSSASSLTRPCISFARNGQCYL